MRGVVFHAYDLTDRKNAYAELTTARELLRCHADELEERVRQRTATLRETNAELEAFTCSVSHDLRTPLQYLRTYAERWAPIPATPFRRAARSTSNASCIRPRAWTPSSTTCSVTAGWPAPTWCWPPSRSSRPWATRSATTSPPSSGPAPRCKSLPPLPRVFADRVGLFQILTNLLSNALKFVEPGRAPAIRIRAETGPVFTRLWIADNGIGVPPRHHEKIFQLFERLQGADEYPGSGVGLALVRKAAIRMGGQCGVESNPGAGSRFWIDFQPDKGGSRLPANLMGESRVRG